MNTTGILYQLLELPDFYMTNSKISAAGYTYEIPGFIVDDRTLLDALVCLKTQIRLNQMLQDTKEENP